jgi:ATP-binding cassette subfamily G (WHITE) protein 2 (SNQ2)
MRAPHSRIPGESRESFTKFLVDTLLTVFGLNHARKTPVGDAAIRGVSGGEKKRVSIAENMAARSCMGAWDNSTRGLDSSTALEFVRALRIATDIGHQSTFVRHYVTCMYENRLIRLNGRRFQVTIYQAGEKLYNLFDKVCVIYEGRMVYFGPASKAREYFIDLGFEPANRQTTADFLVAVTDPLGRIVRPGYEKRVPRTADEFVEAFKSSESQRQLTQDITTYESGFIDGREDRLNAFRQSARAERAKTAPKNGAYTISIFMQVREVMRRRVQIIGGDLASKCSSLFLASNFSVADTRCGDPAQGIVLGSFIFQAIIMGTIFLRMPEATSAYFSRGGVLFL